MDKRPKLDKDITPRDFLDFYWLKEELIQFCRDVDMKKSGGKIEIANRVAHFLKTGQKDLPGDKKTISPKSKFDWHSETLTLETKITDNYKNTANVRRFFLKEIGKHFKFNVVFMNWMKSNSGKTLSDAIDAWKNIKTESKNRSEPKSISPQFEYNTYLRDFLADNPGAKRDEGIALWKIKRSMRGDNVYRKEDLRLLD